MPNYAKIQIIGHAGGDAVLRDLDGGKKVANFSVAVKDYKDNTTWYKVAVFGKSAEAYVGPYLKKGNAVFVSGRPKLEAFLKKDGTAGAAIEITADDVQIMGGDKAAATTPDPQAPLPARAPTTVSSIAEDDIPFMYVEGWA